MSEFEQFNLPFGAAKTEDPEEYVKAWRGLAAHVKEETGWDLYAFDPAFTFQRHGGTLEDVPLEIAKAIRNLHERLEEAGENPTPSLARNEHQHSHAGWEPEQLVVLQKMIDGDKGRLSAELLNGIEAILAGRGWITPSGLAPNKVWVVQMDRQCVINVYDSEKAANERDKQFTASYDEVYVTEHEIETKVKPK